VWDVNNNSSDKTLEFVVQKKQKLALDHILNYPNPFTTHTEFFFEHNQVCSSLQTQIEIYTVTGRLVKTINKMVKTRGFRTEGIPWNGKDEFGDQLAKGVYVYRLTVINPEGDQSQEMQKIYLLK
jgi:flagellar hook assembly protein FlgD